MSFTFTNAITNELSKSPIEGLINNLMGGYEQGAKLRYLKPSLQEQLKKAQLENQYYGPNIESQIGLRGAQAGHANALTAGQNITNKYLPQSLQSAIEVNNANAQKARILQMIREQIMGGSQTQGNAANAGQAPMQMFQGQGMPSGTPQGNQMPYQQPVSFPQEQSAPVPESPAQSPQAFGGDYAKAALASQLMGLGSPKIVDVNGKQVAITPFGNYDTGVQGLTAEQKAREAGFGKEDSKVYGEATHSYHSYANQKLALNELIHEAENNPQFRNVTGPINRPLTEWFGSPEQQRLLGTLGAASGEIALSVAPLLKGAWTGRDQAMVNEIKANTHDRPEKFIGKLKAQALIGNALEERSKLVAQNIRKGYPSIDAVEMAAKATPLSKFRPEIDKLLNPKSILPPNQIEKAERILAKRETEEREAKHKEKHKGRKKHE